MRKALVIAPTLLVTSAFVVAVFGQAKPATAPERPADPKSHVCRFSGDG